MIHEEAISIISNDITKYFTLNVEILEPYN